MKLCDTSVLVDIDRGGVDERVARLDDEGRHVISSVSVTELRLGVNIQYEVDDRGDAIESLDRLLSRFWIHDVDRAVATAGADIISTLRRKGEPLDDLHDVYIAATAKTNQLPVLTANVDDFERIDDIDVVDWNRY